MSLRSVSSTHLNTVSTIPKIQQLRINVEITSSSNVCQCLEHCAKYATLPEPAYTLWCDVSNVTRALIAGSWKEASNEMQSGYHLAKTRKNLLVGGEAAHRQHISIYTYQHTTNIVMDCTSLVRFVRKETKIYMWLHLYIISIYRKSGKLNRFWAASNKIKRCSSKSITWMHILISSTHIISKYKYISSVGAPISTEKSNRSRREEGVGRWVMSLPVPSGVTLTVPGVCVLGPLPLRTLVKMQDKSRSSTFARAYQSTS